MFWCLWCCCCLVFFECWNLWFFFRFDMGYVLNGLYKYVIAAFYVHVCVMSDCALKGKP
jgi:hypothetical protein